MPPAAPPAPLLALVALGPPRVSGETRAHPLVPPGGRPLGGGEVLEGRVSAAVGAGVAEVPRVVAVHVSTPKGCGGGVGDIAEGFRRGLSTDSAHLCTSCPVYRLSRQSLWFSKLKT